MLELEKSQYLNSIFKLHYTKYKKSISYKIVYYKKPTNMNRLIFFILDCPRSIRRFFYTNETHFFKYKE